MIYTTKDISCYNVVTNNGCYCLKYYIYLKHVVKRFKHFNIKLTTTNNFILNIINKTYKLISFN